QNADETFFDALLANELLGPRFLVEGAGVVVKDSAMLVSEVVGTIDEAIGELRGQHLEEVATPDAQDVVDEAFELLGPSDAEMPFENDTIKTMQRAGDETGKLAGKLRY